MTDTLEPVEPEVDFLPALPMEQHAARALLSLRLAIADMDAQRAELAEDGDVNSLLVGLSALRMLVRDLRTLADQVETDASNLMGEQGRREIGIDHVGLFERKKSTTRKNWQHTELARAVVAHALDSDKIHHPMDVVDVLQAAVGFSYWRTTVLREYGFTPDEWCDVDEAHYAIKITGDTK